MTAILIGTVLITAATAAYAIYKSSKTQSSDSSPATLDSFDITKADEGAVVPCIYGKIRTAGNIIYYANLESEEIYEESSSGSKGGSSSSGIVSGYRYFLDVWQVIGEGKLSLVKTYMNDEEQGVEASTTNWSNGTSSSTPAELANAAPMLGVSHAFYRRMFLGTNTTTVPTIHFVVSRTMETGVSYENMTYGNNPAAIIYDLLHRGGATFVGVAAASINKSTFDAAATYWNDKGYALNIAFTEQVAIYEAINTVFSQVDGVLYLDADGKYALAAFDPDAASVATIESDDIYEFSAQIPAYNQLPNSFTATFTDREQAYSKRTIIFENPASIRTVGKRIEKTVDLTGFIDVTAASARMAEIAKTQSYPAIEMEITVDMKYAHVRPGQIITVNYDDLGMSDVIARISSIDYGGIESLNIKIKCSQVVEKAIDSYFTVSGGSEAEVSKITPSDAPLHYYIARLGVNPATGYNKGLLHLAVRDKQSDTYMSLYTYNYETAPSGPTWDSDLSKWSAYAGKCETFSEYAELSDSRWSTFENEPMVINDSTGVEIKTVNRQLDLTGIWAPLTRSGVFTINRFLVIAWSSTSGNSILEYLCFQQMEHIDTTVVGDDTYYHYRLTGIVRWCFWSETYFCGFRPEAGQTLESFGFLTKIDKNVIFPTGNLNYSFVGRPGNWRELADVDKGAIGISFPVEDLDPDAGDLYSFLAMQNPRFWTECRVKITRSGTNVTVLVYPGWVTNNAGAGKGNPDEVTDGDFNYPGLMIITLRNVTLSSSTTVTLSAPNIENTFAGINTSDEFRVYVQMAYTVILPSGSTYAAKTDETLNTLVPNTDGTVVDYIYSIE